MDSAECSAKANIKRALDCSFIAQNSTISLIAEANTLINNCLLRVDECKPCTKYDYSCPDVYNMDYSEVDYKNRTMLNPFYGREYHTDCLMLNIL